MNKATRRRPPASIARRQASAEVPVDLVAAQRRLGRPGRPRRDGQGVGQSAAQPRRNATAPRGTSVPETEGPGRRARRLARAEIAVRSGARLLDVDGAALYLGVSAWTIRDLFAAGRLARVTLPYADTDPRGEVRRLLFDVRDLDALIDRAKERP